MTEDDSFQADGKPEGVLYGFLTKGANISIGGHFEGRTGGLEGVCNDGDAVNGLCTANGRAALSGTNNSVNGGFGVWGSGSPGGHFESNSGDGVVGL